MDEIIEMFARQTGSVESARELVKALQADGLGFVLAGEEPDPPVDRVELIRQMAANHGFELVPIEESNE